MAKSKRRKAGLDKVRREKLERQLAKKVKEAPVVAAIRQDEEILVQEELTQG